MLFTTKVISIKNFNGKFDDNHIYIGRAGHGQDGYFGNPIIRGKNCKICNRIHEKPGDTLECYNLYLSDRIANDLNFKLKVKNLVNKTLICFCENSDKCHGGVLIKHCHILNDW